MRQVIYNLLLNDNKVNQKYVKISGVYPPKIDISRKQTTEQMLSQIETSVKFLKHPEYSYLSKKS